MTVHKPQPLKIHLSTHTMARPLPMKPISKSKMEIHPCHHPKSQKGKMHWLNPQMPTLSGMPHIHVTSCTERDYRNIHMHHWNETQSGGHGLLADFNSYFKLLLDADKEVCLHHTYTVCNPLINMSNNTTSHSKPKCKSSKLQW